VGDVRCCAALVHRSASVTSRCMCDAYICTAPNPQHQFTLPQCTRRWEPRRTTPRGHPGGTAGTGNPNRVGSVGGPRVSSCAMHMAAPPVWHRPGPHLPPLPRRSLRCRNLTMGQDNSGAGRVGHVPCCEARRTRSAHTYAVPTCMHVGLVKPRVLRPCLSNFRTRGAVCLNLLPMVEDV
jgi:hypothetical protein